MRRIVKSDFCIYSSQSQGVFSPCDFVEAAVNRGLETLVFELPKEKHLQIDLWHLREKYAGKLCILFAETGEKRREDMDPMTDLLIGEVETLNLGGKIIPFPKTASEARDAVRYLTGRAYHLTHLYHDAVASLKKRTGCDIVRFFDVNALWNADGTLFDENYSLYYQNHMMCVEKLTEQDVILEICTALKRKGNHPIQYPSMHALRYWGQQRARIVLSSRAESPDMLCTSFREALLQLHACGIGSVYYPIEDGFAQLSI